MRPSEEELRGKELSSDDMGSVLKEPCRSMLMHSTPDSSCLLYWSRRMKASRTVELPPFTQVGSRLLEEPMWDVRAW